MSSPVTSQSRIKIKLNFGSPKIRASPGLDTFTNGSMHLNEMQSQRTPKSAGATTRLTDLLNPSNEGSPQSHGRLGPGDGMSPTPVSNASLSEGSVDSNENAKSFNSNEVAEFQTPPHMKSGRRLLKVPSRRTALVKSDSPSEYSASGASPASSRTASISKKLYLPKRKFRGTKRSVVRPNNFEKNSEPTIPIPPRGLQLKTQPVFGVRGSQAFKSKHGKKSRRKGPQPLVKRVLLKNANFAVFERLKLAKDLKPRRWSLMPVEKLSDLSTGSIARAWQPTSSRMIRPVITTPFTIPVRKPTTSSRSAQPHTIPAPSHVNRSITANRGAIPVVTFIDENGNKRLQCPGKDCPKHFADRCGLNRHKKKYHPELETLGPSQQPLMTAQNP